MKLTDSQLRTLEEVERAGRAVRAWRNPYRAEWRWLVRDAPRSATVDKLIGFGCLAINDNDPNAAELTEFGRVVLDTAARLRSRRVSR